MQFKVIFAFIILVVFTAAGIFGWLQLKEHQKSKSLADKLTLANADLQAGNNARAQSLLQEVLLQNPNLREADAIWAKLAEAYTASGETPKALECWRKIEEIGAISPHYPRALAALASDALSKGQPKEAEKLWDTILSQYQALATKTPAAPTPGPDGKIPPAPAAASGDAQRFAADAVDAAYVGKAILKAQEGDTENAYKALMDIETSRPNSSRIQEVEALLGKMNMEMLRNQPDPILHKVKSGDRLIAIAKQYGTSADLIAKINSLGDSSILSIGRRLRIPKTHFSIEVDKSKNNLLLKNDGKFFKRYPCRTGKEEWQTPAGVYHIQSKVKNPAWTEPGTGKRYPPLHPENELGTRWMAFEGSLGIHGTIRPETVPGYASRGCVGLLKDDVEELFDLVPEGTEVKITGKTEKKTSATAKPTPKKR